MLIAMAQFDSMKKSLIISTAAAVIFFIINSAFGAGHGGRGHGGISGPAAGFGGRSYSPSAPRFPGVSAQHFVGRPHGTFPKASRALPQHPRTSTTGQRPLTVTPSAKAKEHLGTWSHNDRIGKSRLDPQTTAKLRNWVGKRYNSAQANEQHRKHRGHHHDRDWWRHRCTAIVFFDWGYWGWDDGWWFPAWGYDPYYSYYAYDGPIYGYDGLPPDQVVADVQGVLQRLGYYQGAIDGVLGPATQAAIEKYQQDHGLPATGGIDARTLAVLGFVS